MTTLMSLGYVSQYGQKRRRCVDFYDSEDEREKAEDEAQAIRDRAEVEREVILERAQLKAEQIINRAQALAIETARVTASEETRRRVALTRQLSTHLAMNSELHADLVGMVCRFY